MRRILIVLLMMVVGVAQARILHVGDNTIKLSQTKTTTPALHVRVGDEVWYGAMVPTFVKNTLHVRYNSIEYSVLQCEPFTDTTNYTYDESGQLIGANENLYLEKKYSQAPFINTGIIGDKDNLSFNIKYKFQNVPKPNEWAVLFGNKISNPGTQDDHNVYMIVFFNNTARIFTNSAENGFPTYTLRLKNNEFYDMYISQQEIILNGNQLQKDSGIIRVGEKNTSNIALFNSKASPRETPLTYELSIFSFKIWDNDILVRHFVPVPCGLKIGDFVVPENGMWDIVEQKFYGNSGTGEFIYGVDG